VLVRFIHKGRSITLPATQVVVTDDFGQPLAVSYVQGSMVVHCDATHSDFQSVCGDLRLNPPKVQVTNG
jgi:hypothetical protein